MTTLHHKQVFRLSSIILKASIIVKTSIILKALNNLKAVVIPKIPNLLRAPNFLRGPSCLKPFVCLAVCIMAVCMMSASSALAGSLTVEVHNIEKAGEMHLAIYNDADVFENDDGEKGGAAKGILQGVIEPVETGTAIYEFEIPDGTYAIGIFVDVNYNNKMDRNFLGIPKEQYGFSNNAKGSFGPPSFEDAAFTLNGVLRLKINL